MPSVVPVSGVKVERPAARRRRASTRWEPSRSSDAEREGVGNRRQRRLAFVEFTGGESQAMMERWRVEREKLFGA
ncbi:hypothetical protein ACFWBB_24685 [Streptomyces sp. NPDC060000]|uniref:hypothetical protein n=1 Tax=Streptomyces sp. NPDC060000 TaxID=3347031 RepID=UPI003688CF47